MDHVGHSFLASPLSRQVLNTCVINVDLCFVLLPVCAEQAQKVILNQDRLCRIWCFVICAQIEKCSQVLSLVSAEPVQELSFCSPIRKSAASFPIHSYVIRWCCCPGCFAPCSLGKLCQEHKVVYLDLKFENPRTLSSANPCLSLSRTLSSANQLFGSSAHSAKCETC